MVRIIRDGANNKKWSNNKKCSNNKRRKTSHLRVADFIIMPMWFVSKDKSEGKRHGYVWTNLYLALSEN